MTSRFPKRNSSGSVLAELSQLRDELRIKLHLAGLEARAQWESVEPKLLGLERSLEQQGEGAFEAVGELAVELVKAFRDFSVRSQEGGPSKAPGHAAEHEAVCQDRKRRRREEHAEAARDRRREGALPQSDAAHQGCDEPRDEHPAERAHENQHSECGEL